LKLLQWIVVNARTKPAKIYYSLSFFFALIWKLVFNTLIPFPVA